MATHLTKKFFKLLCQADRIGGRFDKAADVVKASVPAAGGELAFGAILDGLAVLTNKHPGWAAGRPETVYMTVRKAVLQNDMRGERDAGPCSYALNQAAKRYLRTIFQAKAA